MINPQLVTQLRELISSVQTALVVLPPQPSYEQAVSASALYEVLRQLGKEVRLLCPNSFSQSSALQGYAASLATLENTAAEIGHQNLSVSFAYDELAVDKVSYHIGEESKRFYLTIKPKPGHPPLDAGSVDFSYTGAESDVVFLVGVQQLEALDQLYFGYEDLYRNSPLVTIHTFEPEFGLIKLDVSGAASQTEVVAQLMLDLELPLSSDVATYLLSGVEAATDGFRSLSTSAHTFEIAAKLLQLGARRIKRESASSVNVTAHKPGLLNESGADVDMTISSNRDVPPAGADSKRKPKALESKKAAKKKSDSDSNPGSLKYQPSTATSRG